MARKVRFHRVGDPEVLQLEEREAPSPGPGEVLLAPRALGLNRSESEFRRGQYHQYPVLPGQVGCEAAGRVRAVGAGVSHVQPGEAVSVVPGFSMNDYGLHGEAVLAPARLVVAHPPHLSWEQAAAVWMMFGTAYGGLIALAGVGEGDTVLITAASSSVGIAAIQTCAMVGARPVALSRSRSKRRALLEAGAAEVIVTTEHDVGTQVQRLTGGQGARVVFDPVGGPGFADLMAALAPQGMALVYGMLSSDTTPLPVRDVLNKWLTVRGYQLFEFTRDSSQLAAVTEFVRTGLTSGALKPVISTTFDLDDIAAAHDYLESNEQFGKIIVRVPQESTGNHLGT